MVFTLFKNKKTSSSLNKKRNIFSLLQRCRLEYVGNYYSTEQKLTYDRAIIKII